MQEGRIFNLSEAKPLKQGREIPVSDTRSLDDLSNIVPIIKNKTNARVFDISETQDFDAEKQKDLLKNVSNSEPPAIPKSAPGELNVDANRDFDSLFDLATKGRDDQDKANILRTNSFFQNKIDPIISEIQRLELRDDAETNPEIINRINKLDNQFAGLKKQQKRFLATQVDPSLSDEFAQEDVKNIFDNFDDGGEQVLLDNFITNPDVILNPQQADLNIRSGSSSLSKFEEPVERPPERNIFAEFGTQIVGGLSDALEETVQFAGETSKFLTSLSQAELVTLSASLGPLGVPLFVAGNSDVVLPDELVEGVQESAINVDVPDLGAPSRTSGDVVRPISQFIGGFVGAGKITKPLQGLNKTRAFVNGAIADGVAFDPHEERLSDLIQSVPELENPVNEYLAASLEDSNAEGRLKNVVEGGILGVLGDAAGRLLFSSLKEFKGLSKAKKSGQSLDLKTLHGKDTKTSKSVISKAAIDSGKTQDQVVKEFKEKKLLGKTDGDVLDEVTDEVNGAVRTKIKNESVIDAADKPPIFPSEVTGREGFDALSKGELPNTPPPTKTQNNILGKAFKGLSDTDVGQFASDIAVPVRTRIKAISEDVAQSLQRFELRTRTESNRYRARIDPFLKATKKAFNKKQRNTFDLAVKNGDFDQARGIIKEAAKKSPKLARQLEDGFEETIQLFDDLFSLSKRAGFKTQRLDNFWPRSVSDHKKLLKSLGSEEQSKINRALNNAEDAKGGKLDNVERSNIINNVLLGRRTPGADVGNIGVLKKRSISQIDENLNKNYSGFEDSALRYIDSVITGIEKHRFFGKSLDTKETDSVGGLVAKLVDEGKVSGQDETKLKKLIQARFEGDANPNKIIGGTKNIFYAATIGNPISAITQLGDLGLSAYRNGIFRTLGSAAETVVGRNQIKLEDIGVTEIAQEFTENKATAKALDNLFKATLFKKVDRLGKTSTINSAAKKGRSLIKTDKGRDKFRRLYGAEFGDETDTLMKDLEEKNLTENVKLFLFNRLSDQQPITLSEMPVSYLKNPNGRVFYALKTFTIKQLDLVRKDIFNKIGSKDKKEVARGLGNLIRYSAVFTVAGAGSDSLKDIVLNREIDIEDNVTANLWRAFGLSRFLVNRATEKGPVAAAANVFAPPISVFDNAYEDTMDAIAGEVESPRDLRSTRNIPGVGQFIYWYFGKGVDRKEKEKSIFSE